MIQIDQNAVFILGSYGVVSIVLLAMLGWLYWNGAVARRQLEEFERAGVRRRQSKQGDEA